MEPKANQTATVNRTQELNAIQQLTANQIMIINQMTAMSCNKALTSLANKCNSLVSANVPDPTQCLNVVNVDNDDDITVVTSNTSLRTRTPHKSETSIAEAMRVVFGNPMPQYLNALTIATSKAIADTVATSIFVMEGTDVENKRQAKIH